MTTISKVYVSTNGCEEGQLSSKHVEQFFRENNLTITTDPTQADLGVFYACGLTDLSEKDSITVIRRLQAKMKNGTQFIVWGCLPKINPQSLEAIYKGPLLGPRDTDFFERLLEKTMVPFDNVRANTLVPRETTRLPATDDLLTQALLLLRKGVARLKQQDSEATTFFILAATGCTGHCTYCSERCVFGKIRSRPIEKIIFEFKWGLRHGYDRFFLAGEDLGAYGMDIGYSLPDLLGEMIKIAHKRNFRITLNQVSPTHLKEMFSDLENVFASNKIELLCSPVQSGSNRILRLMGRTHTAEEWRECMLKINRRFPSIRLKTHFMVGFPTETDEDFGATLRLLDYPLFLDRIGIFKFSERPTVYASRIHGQISEKTKESRRRKLLRKYSYMYAFNAALRVRNALFCA